jgi:Domain of unknown function (DUF6538)
MGLNTKQAAMNQPNYLWKNVCGIYLFRARIPKQFLEYFRTVEIKQSLKTFK